MKYMTITRHRPTISEDNYGNVSYGDPWSNTTVKAMWVGQTRSQEITEGRQTLVTGARAMFPPSADIREMDELTAIGDRWRVTGVIRQRDPVNPDKEWHVTVDLERAR